MCAPTDARQCLQLPIAPMMPLRIYVPSPEFFCLRNRRPHQRQVIEGNHGDGRVANIAALGTGHLPRRRELSARRSDIEFDRSGRKF